MTITIFINGESMQVPANSSLETVVRLIQHQQNDANANSIATAVNEHFIPRTQRADYLVKPGDHIMTFSPITGG